MLYRTLPRSVDVSIAEERHAGSRSNVLNCAKVQQQIFEKTRMNLRRARDRVMEREGDLDWTQRD